MTQQNLLNKDISIYKKIIILNVNVKNVYKNKVYKFNKDKNEKYYKKMKENET